MRSNIIIDKNITNNLHDWILSNTEVIRTQQNSYHEGLVYGRNHIQDSNEFNDFPHNDLKILELKIKDIFNIPTDSLIEPDYGFIIMYAPGNEDGYKCKPHSDRNNNNLIHVRFNVMISKPEIGGMAIIEDDIIEVEENEPWVCVAGLKIHSTVKMEGIKPRIMISFGYLLSRELLIERKWI
jgi:hypothetical protein